MKICLEIIEIFVWALRWDAKFSLYWTKKQDKDDRRSADMICRIN